MSRHVRIRCPICGMLVWQKGLAEEHEFEVKIQNTFSRGRGKITHTYSAPTDEDGVWLLKLALIDKMRAVIDVLEEEVRQDKQANLVNLRDEGCYDKVYSVLSTEAARFAECTSKVTDDGIVVLSVSSPSIAPAVWLLIPKGKSAVVSEIRKKFREQVQTKVESRDEVVELPSQDEVEVVDVPVMVSYYEPVEADADFEVGDVGIPAELLFSVSGVSPGGEKLGMSSVAVAFEGVSKVVSGLQLEADTNETRSISET